MAYFNTVFQFGVEAFCRECQSVGVSALILPDLPIDIYLNDYKSMFDKYGISNVFLITPETQLERIKYIDDNSNAFIYAVTSSSTTGSKNNVSDAETYLSKLKNLNLNTPILAGFNIAKKEDFDFVNQFTNGGIIGSAFIKHLSKSTDLHLDVRHFIESIKPQS
jgi:tryptophan synthase alpha chain